VVFEGNKLSLGQVTLALSISPMLSIEFCLVIQSCALLTEPDAKETRGGNGV
jgi:hypothetical protein